jgi:nanoRNase/pAp phosphatase (c-di-AMP/oligoRNAs hydrolase)
VELSEEEGRLSSSIGNALCKKFPDAPFAACFQRFPDGRVVWSFRSDFEGSNFDVEQIAVNWGGGGHHNASGATVTGAGELQTL